MINRIRASDPHGLNKGHGSKFCVGSQVWQETPKEGQRIHIYKNKDGNNSPKTLNDKNGTQVLQY